MSDTHAAIRYTSGAVYTGQWHRGKQHGYGTMQFPDGSKYEGNWEENQMNSNGKYLDPDGMLWEGIFVENTFESKIQKKLQIELVTKGTSREPPD